MTPSPAGIALIRSFEGCRLVSYMPTPHDVPTIGWGQTHHADGSPVRMGETWTQDQADADLLRSVSIYAAKVASLLQGAPTTQHQFDAMTCFAYNIGVGALAGSTLLRLHKAGDYAGAAAQFARWNKQGGVALAGLTRRRTAEAALYSL